MAFARDSARSARFFCAHRGHEWRISCGARRIFDVRRAGGIFAVEFSERPRVSRRCRQPLVGYLLAVMAILPHFYTKQNPHPLAVLSPLLVLAIPLIDLAQVVILRTLNRKPFWIGDTNHLSHRLVRRGLSRTQAVLVALAGGRDVGAVAYFLTCRIHDSHKLKFV